MTGPLHSSSRSITVVVGAALLVMAAALLGCAGGPKPLDVVIPGDMTGAEEVRVIEYLGSNAGDSGCRSYRAGGWFGRDHGCEEGLKTK